MEDGEKPEQNTQIYNEDFETYFWEIEMSQYRGGVNVYRYIAFMILITDLSFQIGVYPHNYQHLEYLLMATR